MQACVSGSKQNYSFLCEIIRTLSNMKGNFLILLVTANTTYTTFGVVYTKIMLYTKQFLFSQSEKSCYTKTRAVYPRTQMFMLCIHSYIQCTHKYVLYLNTYSCISRDTCCVPTDATCLRCLNENSIAYLTTEIKSKESQIISSLRIYILRIVFLLIMQ